MLIQHANCVTRSDWRWCSRCIARGDTFRTYARSSVVSDFEQTVLNDIFKSALFHSAYCRSVESLLTVLSHFFSVLHILKFRLTFMTSFGVRTFYPIKKYSSEGYYYWPFLCRANRSTRHTGLDCYRNEWQHKFMILTLFVKKLINK